MGAGEGFCLLDFFKTDQSSCDNGKLYMKETTNTSTLGDKGFSSLQLKFYRTLKPEVLGQNTWINFPVTQQLGQLSPTQTLKT